MLKLPKNNSEYEKGDKINIIVTNPKLNNFISIGMKSDNFLTNLTLKMCDILT